jgi:tetratricopeptide (TPR) repeat protein
MARSLNTIGWIHGEMYDVDHSLEWNERGLDLARQIPSADPEFENNAILNLGDALLLLGDLDGANQQYREVERIVRNPADADRWMMWRYSQHLFHSMGELSLARGELDRALAYADECIDLAEGSSSRKNIVKGRRLRAKALAARGELEEARSEVDGALATARAIGNPGQLWKTWDALGDIYDAMSKRTEASVAWSEAVGVVDRVAGSLADAALRESLLGSRLVSEIRAKLA